MHDRLRDRRQLGHRRRPREVGEAQRAEVHQGTLLAVRHQDRHQADLPRRRGKNKAAEAEAEADRRHHHGNRTNSTAGNSSNTTAHHHRSTALQGAEVEVEGAMAHRKEHTAAGVDMDSSTAEEVVDTDSLTVAEEATVVVAVAVAVATGNSTTDKEGMDSRLHRSTTEATANQLRQTSHHRQAVNHHHQTNRRHLTNRHHLEAHPRTKLGGTLSFLF